MSFGRRGVSASSEIRILIAIGADSSHEINKSGGKADQNKHDQTPRRCGKKVVETPADSAADENAPDKCGRKAKAIRHR